MAFSRRFPKDKPGSPYASWEEIYLTLDDEHKIEAEQKKENIQLMKECILDAKNICSDLSLKDFQSDIISLAIALFEKRSSHTIYWKEEEAKRRFDEKNQ